MPQYETLDGFKKKLKNGQYDNATGARRAVGKMRTWEDPEKDAARKVIDRHFGDAAKPPAKKAASKKKVAPKKKFKRKKKTVKKVAAKKVAKKAAAKSPTPTPPSPAKKSKKKAKKKSTSRKASTKGRALSPAKQETALNLSPIQERVVVFKEVADSYEGLGDKLKNLQSEKVNVTEGLNKISASMTRLIDAMDKQLLEPLISFQEQKGAELFGTSAPDPANGIVSSPLPTAPAPDVAAVVPPA